MTLDDSKDGGLALSSEEALALLEICLLSPLEVTPTNISALIKLARYYQKKETPPSAQASA